MSGQRKPALTGGCQCGAVRYALYAEPDRAGICHCRMCQKSVGGPFMAWASVRMEHFAWTRGAPGGFLSSSAAERGFCPRCGTPLCFAYIKRPGLISVTIGSLDTPASVRLMQVDGIESRLANFDPAALAAPPVRATGEASLPEDLTHITNFQHPDHDTPADWRPPAA
ncbi:MAG TPA: GFA family protein [Acetobacteraceae bacterium]|nr:GFA family protein [Acetobacteraceae bacterium]